MVLLRYYHNYRILQILLEMVSTDKIMTLLDPWKGKNFNSPVGNRLKRCGPKLYSPQFISFSQNYQYLRKHKIAPVLTLFLKIHNELGKVTNFGTSRTPFFMEEMDIWKKCGLIQPPPAAALTGLSHWQRLNYQR